LKKEKIRKILPYKPEREKEKKMKMTLRKTSLVDYPGKVAATLFFAGCDLRCPWCHNRELVLGVQGEDLIAPEEALAHIRKRRRVLGGVVLSGGEPTLWTDLPALIAEIKKLGLSVKLDTNGMRPDALEKIFEKSETSPDYIALDLKFAPDRYNELLAGKNTGENPADALKRSAEIIKNSGVTHEYRTLALPVLKEEDLNALADLTDNAAWYVRPFSPGNCLAPEWNTFPPSAEESIDLLVNRIQSLGKNGIKAGAFF
jgi:pyruvate formate lyase activating enzyme